MECFKVPFSQNVESYNKLHSVTFHGLCSKLGTKLLMQEVNFPWSQQFQGILTPGLRKETSWCQYIACIGIFLYLQNFHMCTEYTQWNITNEEKHILVV